MGRTPHVSGVLLLALSWLGCGGDDGGLMDAEPSHEPALALFEPLAPMPPALAPCPPGWREVPSEGGPATCDPWPDEGGAPECAADEAPLPGEGCVRVGTECPADGLPAKTGADGAVVYVRAGATGGDGSRAAPHGAFTEFSIGSLVPGDTIAVGTGTYDVELVVPAGVTLLGACPAETVLTSTTPEPRDGVIRARGAGGVVRNLSVRDSLRPGISVESEGQSLFLESLIVEQTTEMAVVSAIMAEVVAEGLLVRDVRSTKTDNAPILLAAGGSMRLSRSVIVDNSQTSVLVGTGSSLEMEDVAILDTRGDLLGAEGRGLAIAGGSSVQATRLVVERSRELGIIAIDDATSLRMDRAIIRDTLGRDADDLQGIGLQVQDGATVEATALLLSGNATASLNTLGTDSEVTLRDVVIRDTRVEELTAMGGAAFVAEMGANLRMERGWLERNQTVGILVAAEGTSVTLQDVVIRDTRPIADMGRFGRGVECQFEATCTLMRVSIEDNRDIGLVAIAGGNVEGTDVTVTRTAERACAASSCAGAEFGVGIASGRLSPVNISRFKTEDNALCGLLVYQGGVMDASQGLVRNNLIGLCIQEPGYDVSRSMEGVQFFENGTNLDTTELPTPDASVRGF